MLTANRLLVVTTSFLAIIIASLSSVGVEVQAQSPPYNNITLTMYALDGQGKIVSIQNPCLPSPQEKRNGCTDDPTQPYPFSTNPVAINIENHQVNNMQQGYLHNVTPGEVAITVSSQGNKPLSCVKSQAIASRTYAYYQIQQGATINNSNQFQVYIPYKYQGLTPAQQQRVNEAVSEVLYMTASGSTDPIRAHFGADNDTTTADGGESYLKSVYDPISHLGTDYGTSNGGMSSRGCSRWGFGHTSSRGPVTSDNSNYPGDSNGNGNFWSVRWDEAAQILLHYYSDAVLRDQYGREITPAYRWNPLSYTWANTGTSYPPAMNYGGTDIYPFNFTLQNSGKYGWRHPNDGGNLRWYLAYRWRKGSNVQQGSQPLKAGISRFDKLPQVG